MKERQGLHDLHVVSRVTEHPRQARLADLVELDRSEGGGQASVLVIKPITSLIRSIKSHHMQYCAYEL